jgi:hypothetical protein
MWTFLDGLLQHWEVRFLRGALPKNLVLTLHCEQFLRQARPLLGHFLVISFIERKHLAVSVARHQSGSWCRCPEAAP